MHRRRKAEIAAALRGAEPGSRASSRGAGAALVNAEMLRRSDRSSVIHEEIASRRPGPSDSDSAGLACGSEAEQGHHSVCRPFTTEEQRRRTLEQRSEVALAGVLQVLSTGAVDWNVAAGFRRLADAGRVIAFGRCDPIFVRALLDALRLNDIEVLPRPTVPPSEFGWKPFLTVVEQSGVDLDQSVLYTADIHDIPLARSVHATTLVRPNYQAVRAFHRARVPMALGNWARDDIASATATVLGTSAGRTATR